MRRGVIADEFDRVTCRLWVGGIITPQVARDLQAVGVTHVLNTAIELDDTPFLSGTGLVGFKAGTADDRQRKGWDWFAQPIPWSLKVLAAPKTQLYVHCHAGLHRSTSMTYAIMRSQGFSTQDAAGIIQRARHGAYLDYQNDAERELRQHGWILC